MFRKAQISGIFGESPIRPLQVHMNKVVECTETLVPFFDAVVAEDWDEVRRLQAEISRLENEADDLKHRLRLKLPKSLFLPVPRNELLDLLTMQDRVANKAKDIAGIMTGREMRLPDAIKDCFPKYVSRAVDAAHQACTTVNELDELIETGFYGHEVDLVESMINKLNEIEKDTDNMQIEIRAALYAVERDLPPVEVMFTYQIIDWVGDLGDRAQRVGSRLQLLLAR